jgi:RNA polymerase sigma factor (TIGR02999 family)
LYDWNITDFTHIVEQIREGNSKSADELLPLIYEELRRLAMAKMAQQAPGQTLQATALVHEAWLKLSADGLPKWLNREHFFRACAEAMRHILIDRARAKQSKKRGAGEIAVDWNEVEIAENTEPDALLLVDEALNCISAEHPDKAELVKLRFYAGFTIEEAAQALGVSEKTIKRQWTHARALLFREITRLRSE